MRYIAVLDSENEFTEEVIEDLKNTVFLGDNPHYEFEMLSIEKQERKVGKWIRVGSGSLIDDFRCDCCNKQPALKKVGYTWGWDFTDYCPNCGAKMIKE